MLMREGFIFLGMVYSISMRFVSIIFLIIGIFYSFNVFAGSEDFFDDFKEVGERLQNLNVPADQTFLYTAINNLKKDYWVKAQAINDSVILLENISRSSKDDGAEIEYALAGIKKQIADMRVLDAPKGKALDLVGKLRNEAVHERLVFLQKQEEILRNAQFNGISKVVEGAKQEGVGILAALDRQLDNQNIAVSAVMRRDFPSNQKMQPNHAPPPEQPVSDKMRRMLAERAKKGTRNAFPIDPNDGFGGVFPCEKDLHNRVKPTTLVVSVIPSKSSFFSKALSLGVKGLKVLPLVGELWTRKENALITSAHALTEACIRNESNAGETALYVGMQYAYRGFGFLSFVPNLADSATPESIQGTLNFLLNAGCFDEYREFIGSNKDVFADLGLGDISILSPAEVAMRERQYEDLQKRLNTPLTVEEIIANRKATNDMIAQDLANKRMAFGACCMLVATKACPLQIKNDLIESPLTVSASSDKRHSPLLKADTTPVISCSQLQADIKNLESYLFVK